MIVNTKCARGNWVLHTSGLLHTMCVYSIYVFIVYCNLQFASVHLNCNGTMRAIIVININGVGGILAFWGVINN